MPASEAILLKRFTAENDARALAELIKQNAPMVYGVCLRILIDKDKAADAVQETFLQLVCNAADISNSLPSWLHRVATHRSIDLIRSDSLRRQRELQYAGETEKKSEQENATWNEISRYIDEELDNLDDQTREILILHFFQGKTMTDVAAKCDVSVATVSRRIESSVAVLRHKLKSRGVLVPAAMLTAMLTENIVKAAPALVMKELGKIVLAGGQAATTATGSGILASLAVKAKIVATAAIITLLVGSAAIYYNSNNALEADANTQSNSDLVETAQNGRVVHLPKDLSIGRVMLAERPESSQTWWNWVTEWNKKDLGETKGDISVPSGRLFWLHVNNNFKQEHLSSFQPDDIQILNLYDCSELDDKLLQKLVKLSGLEMLMLGDGTYTGEGLEYLTQLENLKALVLPGFVRSQDLVFLRRMPALESLHFGLESSPMITDEKMAEIGKITYLTQLSLIGSEIGPSLVHLKNLKSLRFLDLSANSNLDIDRHLANIAGLTELEVLDLTNTQVGDVGLAHLTGLTKLKKLNINSNPMTFKVTDTGMVYLANLKSLEEIDLPFGSITDNGIAQLAQLNSLKKIQLYNDDITDKSLDVIAKMGSVEDFGICSRNITDAGLIKITQLLSLKALSINNCPITNEGIASLADMKTLSKLGINKTQIDSEGLTILRELPELTELNLTYMNLGSKGIPNLANLPKLQRLWLLLNRSTNFRDEDLVSLGSLTALNFLDIQLRDVSQSRITNAGLQNLSGLKNLTYLSIPGNINVTDEGLKFLSNLKALEELNIYYCSVTDAGLKHIEGLTSLRRLLLYDTRVTKKGETQLKSKIPGLYIDIQNP